MNYERTSCSIPRNFSEETNTLISTATSLYELLGRWLTNKEHSVKLATGMDDNDKHSLVWVQLSNGREQEAEFFLPLQDVLAVHAHTRPIENFVSLQKRGMIPELDIDDRQFDAYMGLSVEDYYDDDLCAPVISLQQALPAILAFACSQFGEVSLDRLDADFVFDDMPDVAEKFKNRNLIDAHFTHGSLEISRGCRPTVCQSLYIEVLNH